MPICLHTVHGVEAQAVCPKHKVKNLSSLALCGESLSTPELEELSGKALKFIHSKK